ncbi:AAA family ATPase [Deinococcus cellulosilyticus]|nr:AAA family ATPase [Deinococcus cellulosilyticus]
MTQNSMQEVMRQLADIRSRRDITLLTVSKRIGVRSKQSVLDLENSDNPTIRSVLKYAEALGVGIELNINRCHVLPVFNHAGGVGKSTTTRDLGYALAELFNFRVLLIDADSQANLTEMFGLNPAQIPLDQTINHIWETEELSFPEPVKVTEKLHLVPSQLEISGLELSIPTVINGQNLLSSALKSVREQYDFVLIDCPPSVGQVTMSCLLAGDAMIVPTPPKEKTMGGLPRVFKVLNICKKSNPNYRIALFVTTRFVRNVHSTDEGYYEEIAPVLKKYGPVSQPIGERTLFEDAWQNRKSILQYRPDSEAAREVITVTEELLASLNVQVNVNE